MGILDRWAVRRVSRLQEQEKLVEDNVLRRNSPHMSAYRISNGYVLSMGNSSNEAMIGTSNKLVYCKDHKEIADQLVAHEARKQMNVPEQMQMDFGQSATVKTKIINY